jgi:Leucine-rich repeat (LRR) protein
MSDRDLLRELEKRVGRPFVHALEGDRCVEIDLTSADHVWQGLIRRHSAAEKLDIMQLISRLTGLRKLNLRRNKLGLLPEAFRELHDLEHLNLGSNYLGRVPEQIRGFRHLTYLHLGNNDITELPEWMGDFARLEYLALHKHLKLRSVDVLAGQADLRTLNLYFVNLGRGLPDFLYGLTKLVSLTIWRVDQLSDAVDRWVDLEFFTDCGAPGLQALPDGFTRLRKLRMTRLFQNGLESLPEDFGDLENLEQVSLYQNRLSRLPDSMARLEKLRKLNLGWNRFETLPPWLSRLASLEWLAVFANPLAGASPIPAPPTARVVREWPFTTLHEPSRSA